jgi:hypothetical protein
MRRVGVRLSYNDVVRMIPESLHYPFFPITLTGAIGTTGRTEMPAYPIIVPSRHRDAVSGVSGNRLMDGHAWHQRLAPDARQRWRIQPPLHKSGH